MENVQTTTNDVDYLNDTEFEQLFNGKYDVSTPSLAFDAAFNYLETVNARRSAQACVIFATKPLVYLVTGLTKQLKGDNIGVSVKLLKLLPHLPSENWSSITSLARKKLGTWAYLNMSMIRRIAYMYIETFPEEVICKQWIKLYGGSPNSIRVVKGKGSETTKRILLENLTQFQSNSTLWSPSKLSEVIARQEVQLLEAWEKLGREVDSAKYVLASTYLKPNAPVRQDLKPLQPRINQSQSSNTSRPTSNRSSPIGTSYQ